MFYDGTVTDSIRFRDFSTSPEPVTFRIAPDTFECWPEIPLDSLIELSTLSTMTDRKAQMDAVKDLIDAVMSPEQAAVFRRRCRPGTKEEPNTSPIGVRHIQDLLPWLMEAYGLRPTPPSSESEDGSTETDISSTDGASLTE